MKRIFGPILTVLLFTAVPALAADPTGNWRFDTNAFRTAMQKIMADQVKQMPIDMQSQMEAAMQTIMQQMLAQMSGIATFNSDHTAIFTRDDGNQEIATWEDQGDRIKITPSNDGEPGYAKIDGDVMIMQVDDPNSSASLEMIWKRE